MSQAYQAMRRQGANNNQAAAKHELVRTFPQLLELSRGEIARALPKHLSVDRIMRIALTSFRMNPGLGKCSPMSVLAAVVQASQLGLEIGMMGEAHLVPFKSECQLIPGYTGLMKLARQSGQVTDIYAHEVRENDLFQLRLGIGRDLVHEPLSGKGGFPATAQARGEITGFYAVCIFKDGSNTFVALSAEDVNRVRDRSSGYRYAKRTGNLSPWDTDYVEMGKKTCIRALAKVIPKSPELAKALNMDTVAEVGGTQNITLEQAADGTYEVVPPVDQDTGEIFEAKSATQNSQQDAQLQPVKPQPPQEVQQPAAQQEKPQPEKVRAPVEQGQGKVSPLAKHLEMMKQSNSTEQLDEIYIRAEPFIQSRHDKDALDDSYIQAKSRIQGAGLLL